MHRRIDRPLTLFLAMLVATCAMCSARADENWPRWRGPDGNAVSASSSSLPVTWSSQDNVRWKTEVPGEGSSSPVIWQDRIFLTSALKNGTRRAVHCIDRTTGQLSWTREVGDENPELASALTGHAASTPVTDGTRVVAFFGNAGVVCYDNSGGLLWHRTFGEFESELGLASSPVLFGDTVIVLCDHDGDDFRSFHSFLIALDLKSGETRWQTDRPDLFRSWSTPLVVPVQDDGYELIVAAQDAVRAYDPETGQPLWSARGTTGWVAPSPVFGGGAVFATSGKSGPTMAIAVGGRGDVTESHVRWQVSHGGAYVCSPLLYNGLLYVHDEAGILTCREAATGHELYKQRLEGKFIASGIAGDGKIYLTNDAGDTFVIRAGETFELLAKNSLHEDCLASPAVYGSELFLRTGKHLYCLSSDPAP